MNSIGIINLASTFAAFISTLVVSILLYWSYRKNRIVNTLYLMGFFLALSLHNLIFMLATLSFSEIIAKILFKLMFLGPLGVLLLLLFAESLRTYSPYTKVSFIGTFLFAVTTADELLLSPVLSYRDGFWFALKLRSDIGYVSLMMFYFFASLMVIYVYFLMYKNSVSQRKRRQTFIFLLSSIMGFIGTMLAILYEILFVHELVLEFLIIAIASSILGIAYLSNPYVSFLLVNKIYKIMVVQNTGLLCYSRSVHEEKKINDEIIAGFIQAILLFGKESLGSRTPYTDICVFSFGDRRILLKEYKDIIGIMIVDNTSDAIKNALKEFTIKFWDNFKDNIREPGAVITPEKADELFLREFSLLIP